MIAHLRWLIVGALLAGATDVRFADATARELVERSRAHIVQNGASIDLRSLILKGRVRVPGEGAATTDGTVEIRILLPDRFLRVDTYGATERRSGVAGRTLLSTTPASRSASDATADASRRSAATSDPSRRNDAKGESDVRRARAELTRLMLGLAPWAATAEALVVKSTGEAAFADTAAVDVNSPGFSARLVFDTTMHVPLRVVYFAEGGVSMVVSFANRRVTGGLELPFRITTQTPDRVLETLMLDEIVVNPPLTAADFKP
jgi:hypothetical protein